RNASSTPPPCIRPVIAVPHPHWLPSSIDITAAIISASSAAPGLRTMSPASSAGRNQIPASRPSAGLNAAVSGPIRVYSCPYPRNATPKAAPLSTVTSRSTVRKRVITSPSSWKGRGAPVVLHGNPDSLRRCEPDQVRGSALAAHSQHRAVLPCQWMTVPESTCSASGADRLVDRVGGGLRILGGEDVVRRAAADDLHQRPGARDQHAVGLLDLVEGEDLAGGGGGPLLGARGARPAAPPSVAAERHPQAGLRQLAQLHGAEVLERPGPARQEPAQAHRQPVLVHDEAGVLPHPRPQRQAREQRGHQQHG